MRMTALVGPIETQVLHGRTASQGTMPRVRGNRRSGEDRRQTSAPHPVPEHERRAFGERRFHLSEEGRGLRAVTRAFDAALAGRGSLVLVEAGAGCGKSRLLDDARAVAEARGIRVLGARGHAVERAFSFAVAAQLFEPVVRGARADDAFAGAARLAYPVLGLEPGFGLSGFDALRGLYSLAANLAEIDPLVLIIDDLHWADADSLHFIEYLVRRIDALAMTVVASVGSGARQTLRTLPLERATTVVNLPPWSAARSMRWLRERLPEAGTATLTVTQELARGNPWLLSAVADGLDAQAPLPDPASLRGAGERALAHAGLARLARLAPDTIDFADALAVLGSGAALRHTAALAGLSPDEAAALVAQLVDDGTLSPDPGLDFAYPLTRDAVYADLPLADRCVAHARAAAILRDGGASPEAIAEHILAGEPGAVVDAVEELRAAARDAAGRGAPDVAAAYLRRAMLEPGAGDVRPGVVRDLGLALLSAFEPDAQAVLSEALELMDDPHERATVGLELARGLGARGRTRDGVETCRIVVAEPVEPTLAVQLEAELAACAGLVPATAALAVEFRARVAARASDDPSLAPHTLALRGTALVASSTPADEATPLLREALESSGPRGMPRWLAFEAALACDEGEAVTALIHADLEAALARGDRPSIAALLTLRAVADLRAGRLAAAEAAAARALDLRCATSTGPNMGWAVTVYADVLFELGRFDDAADAIARALSSGAPADDHLRTAQLLERRARLRGHAGDLEAGIADALRAGELLGLLGITNPALCGWRSRAALLLDQAGDPVRARELVDEELRLARRFGRPRAIGVALHRRGLLSSARCCGALHDAAGVLETVPAPLELATALLDLGATLRCSRRRDDARVPLRRALDLADEIGATGLAQRARDELLSAGARPRRARLSGPEALTATERRVALLAAQGRSNPQIAEELFVTRRTVEVHLTRSYQKLGIASRSELADALSQ